MTGMPHSSLAIALIAAAVPALTAIAGQPPGVIAAGAATSAIVVAGLAVAKLAVLVGRGLEVWKSQLELQAKDRTATEEHRVAQRVHWARSEPSAS